MEERVWREKKKAALSAQTFEPASISLTSQPRSHQSISSDSDQQATDQNGSLQVKDCLSIDGLDSDNSDMMGRQCFGVT